ncbi:MAG: hypothetical protein ACON5C_00900 [Alphaproteobacteria bacterium]
MELQRHEIVSVLSQIEQALAANSTLSSRMEYTILVLAADCEEKKTPCPLTFMQHALDVSYPTARRAIQRMVDADLVELVSIHHDHRMTSLKLTEKGWHEIDRMCRRVHLQLQYFLPIPA